jgi:hypothetical protein
MNDPLEPLDLGRLKVYPLEQRRSLSRIEQILVEPSSSPPPLDPPQIDAIRTCAVHMRHARDQGAAILLIYGAHLIKNGGQLLINQLLDHEWLTHLATNGAGTIHDWEFAWLGRSTESVRANVATGTFGTWDETGRCLQLALLAGGLEARGYGAALGRFILDDGVTLPEPAALEEELRRNPSHPLAPARAELLAAMHHHRLSPGHHGMVHRWRNTSVLARAAERRIPLTVHPGIGYDIISNQPLFNGAAIGRAAEIDFRLFGATVERLDHGVVLSVGSAIMGPQVFEKSLSCVNNLRLQAGRPIGKNHSICVVDIQDGGNWDWSKGEPATDNPAYYLRFCKSYARMGGSLQYIQCDNVAFLHHLSTALAAPAGA